MAADWMGGGLVDVAESHRKKIAPACSKNSNGSSLAPSFAMMVAFIGHVRYALFFHDRLVVVYLLHHKSSLVKCFEISKAYSIEINLKKFAWSNGDRKWSIENLLAAVAGRKFTLDIKNRLTKSPMLMFLSNDLL